MSALIAAIDAILGGLRLTVFAIAVAAALVALVDWLVRTKRISPFGRTARFFRTTIDPFLAPIERRVVRAGGMPTAAPWWTLVVVVVSGIVLLSLVGFLRDQLVSLAVATRSGPRGVVRFVISAIVGVLQLALAVRVISGWVRISPYSRWIRWSYVLTEPLIRPLRRIVPPLGMIDVTPLVAWVGLLILQSLILGILR